MSDIITAAVAALSEKVSGGLDGTAKFVIEGEGAIVIDGDTVRAGDEPADVTLTASAEDFRAMLDGELNPTAAFMQGKLAVDGNMGLAMQLGAILA